MTGEETKDGAFDGGYAFADYCPLARGGFDQDTGRAATASAATAGDRPARRRHLHHARRSCRRTRPIAPVQPGHGACFEARLAGRPTASPARRPAASIHAVREEDVNVDLGDEFEPGDPAAAVHRRPARRADRPGRHAARGARSTATTRPLCDKRLVVLQNKQNANADFFMMTNQRTAMDVAEPGRIVGLVSDDIYFDRDQQSIWYGEARPDRATSRSASAITTGG